MISASGSDAISLWNYMVKEPFKVCFDRRNLRQHKRQWTRAQDVLWNCSLYPLTTYRIALSRIIRCQITTLKLVCALTVLPSTLPLSHLANLRVYPNALIDFTYRSTSRNDERKRVTNGRIEKRIRSWNWVVLVVWWQSGLGKGSTSMTRIILIASKALEFFSQYSRTYK